MDEGDYDGTARSLLNQLSISLENHLYQTELQDKGYYTMRATMFKHNDIEYYICAGRCDPEGFRSNQFAISIEMRDTSKDSKEILGRILPRLQESVNGVQWNPHKGINQSPELYWRYEIQEQMFRDREEKIVEDCELAIQLVRELC